MRMEDIHTLDPSKLLANVRELVEVSDKVDKPKYICEQLWGDMIDFQNSMTVVPIGEMPGGLFAQALQVNLGVSVEGYKSEQVDKDELVDEDFQTTPVPEHEVPDPAPYLIF